MATKKEVITELCSICEYLLDRGEIETFYATEEHVRYTRKQVDSFVVKSKGRNRYKISIEEIKL